MANLKHSISCCKQIQLPKIFEPTGEPRGNLTFIEETVHVPFTIKRMYYLYDIPAGVTRAGHAHKDLVQFLIAMSGSFDVLLDDGREKKVVHLNRPYIGLLITPMIWRVIDNFSSGSVCVALADAEFLESDYIRDYEAFLAAVKADA